MPDLPPCVCGAGHSAPPENHSTLCLEKRFRFVSERLVDVEHGRDLARLDVETERRESKTLRDEVKRLSTGSEIPALREMVAAQVEEIKRAEENRDQWHSAANEAQEKYDDVIALLHFGNANGETEAIRAWCALTLREIEAA